MINKKTLKNISVLTTLFFVLTISIMTAQASQVTRSFSTTTPVQCSNLTVTLTVTVTAPDSFYIIDEYFPTGWTVVNAGGGATGQGGLSWVDISATNMVYTYIVTVPCNASGNYPFNGTYAFDGYVQPYPQMSGQTSVDIFACMDMDGDTVNTGGGVCGPVDCNDNNASVYRLARLYTDMDSDSYVAGGLSIPSYCIGAMPPMGYSEVSSVQDCNDMNSAVNPGAVETCNNIDDNCNGIIDEGVTTTFYRDLDNDSFGNPISTTQACSVPAGYVLDNTDCNDNTHLVHPGTIETCNFVDDNCVGGIDEGFATLTYYNDSDNDTYGNPSVPQTACMTPTGYVLNNTDCNDNNASIYRLLTGYADLDADTFTVATSAQVCSGATLTSTHKTSASASTDCNDNNAAIKPTAIEVCDGADNNCNGQIDEGVISTYYRDFDADTYGNIASTILACTLPAGYVNDNTDCNDNNAAIKPTALETCNNIDDNCNTQVDESLTRAATCGVGICSLVSQTETCSAGSWSGCNPLFGAQTEASSTPATCTDGLDNDCDGTFDTNFTNPTTPDASCAACTNETLSCALQQGVCAGATQTCSAGNWPGCDATTYASFNPAYEANIEATCTDGSDNDCDGLADFNDPDCASQCTDGDNDGYNITGGVCGQIDCNDADLTVYRSITLYSDTDSDTYTSGAGVTQCIGASIPAGYTSTQNPEDCNDNNATIYTNYTLYKDTDMDTYTSGAAVVMCLGAALPSDYKQVQSAFDDCNDTNTAVYKSLNGYLDFDADSYTLTNPTTVCTNGTLPALYKPAVTTLDCNDASFTVNPGATEACNLIDDDCDGQIDEGVKTTFYQDFDNDTFGNLTSTTQACTVPAGYVLDNNDCNDQDTLAHMPLWGYPDFDNDTYTLTQVALCTHGTLPTNYLASISAQLDCNDNNSTLYRNANVYTDADNDGVTINVNQTMCIGLTAPSGYTETANPTDCDDNNNLTYQNLAGYADIDADNYTVNVSTQVCSGLVLNSSYRNASTVQTDCNDASALLYQYLTGYADLDGDGYTVSASAAVCSGVNLTAGYLVNSTSPVDCNDANAGIRPGATEIANNGVDDNCDGISLTTTTQSNVGGGGSSSGGSITRRNLTNTTNTSTTNATNTTVTVPVESEPENESETTQETETINTPTESGVNTQAGTNDTTNQSSNELTGQVVGERNGGFSWLLTIGVIALIIAILVGGYFAFFRGKGGKKEIFQDGWLQK